MSIAVECPHCESRYHLQPDLLGKPMRCPNPDCREVFIVAEAADRPAAPPPEPEPQIEPPRPTAPHRTDAPPPAFVSGTVGDLVPVVEAEAMPTLTFPPAEKPYQSVEADEEYVIPVIEGEAAAAPRPALPRAAVVMDAEPAGLDDPPRVAKPSRPGRPKEVAWSDAAEPLAPPPATQPAVVEEQEEDDEPLRRRRSRKAIPVGILMGLIGLILFIALGVAGYLIRHEMLVEGRMAEEASEAFKTAAYPKATDIYTQLLAKYPTSEKKDLYEFFNELSTLHTQVGSVTFKENPSAEAYKAFLEKYGDAPLAQPDEGGFGHDVFEAGRKIVEAAAENGKDRLGRYRANLSKLDELAAAEKTVNEGLKLVPTVEKYRVKDIPPLTEQQKALEGLAGQFGKERHRLKVLTPWRKLADDPTDLKIAEFVAVVKQNDLEKDREAQQIIDAAKANLRKLIRTVVGEVRPVPAPADVAPRLLFIAAPAGDKAAPAAPPAPDAAQETFFAVDKGILYALDADTGNLLWAAEVGRDRGVDDLPVRVPLGEGGAELVVVPSHVGGKPGLTARVARTGEPYWHQPLEAPPAARPVLVGKRVYVPILDDAGTVVEVEATAGTRLAHVALRQRLGGGMLRQPGTGLVFVAAEGRRVFVLDVEPLDADGNREAMRCVQVLATDHPDQSLKTPPVLTGPAGDAPAPRFLILAQADGTQQTRVRAFAVPPVSKDRKPTDPPAEVAPPAAGAATLPGHVTFPPASDGERVAVVTDAGAFALYGTNQPGNQDPGLYPLPSTALPTDPKQPKPGQVVYAEENDFWVLSRGNLVRLRLALTPASGLSVAPDGVPRPTGVPLHRAQANARRDTALAVVRSDESDGVWAVAFDPRDGRVKWQKKIGAVPPVPPVPMADGSALLVDEDGGMYHLPTEAAAVADAGTRSIAPAWVVAPPSLIAAGPPRVAVAADGSAVWVLIPERGEKGRVVRVRRFADGKLAAEAVLALPDRFAGDPVAVGPTVVFPLADDFVYRYEPGASALTKGPQWRGEGVPADAGCFLSTAGGDLFVGSDGGRRVRLWRWPAATGSDWAAAAGPWEARAKVAFAPVVVAAGANARRVLAADVAGSVWLFDADKAGDPLRRWRGSDGGPVPAGVPAGGFVAVSAGGKPRVVYGVGGRHLVCLDPNEKDPAWVAAGKDGAADLLGWTAAGDRVVATDQAGRVTVYAADGAVVGTAQPGLADAFPQVAGVAFAGGKVLLPLWDGSAVFLAAAGR